MLWSPLLGDLQKLPGHRPGHPALGGPAGAGVGPDAPRSPDSLSHFALNAQFCCFPSPAG